jgi:hypothetical protein
MRILISGDSFAVPNTNSWADLLAKDFKVTNIAQAGVSEYKILNQVKQFNLSNYDLVVVSHTSYSRVHTRKHPTHSTALHKDCDLILADIENKNSVFNQSLRTAKGWFKYHYDEQYQIDIYKLLREKVNQIIKIPYIAISHLDLNDEFIIEKNFINFKNLWKAERGPISHYSEYGNQIVYNTVKNEILKIYETY